MEIAGGVPDDLAHVEDQHVDCVHGKEIKLEF
jgi:hypothetical protein